MLNPYTLLCCFLHAVIPRFLRMLEDVQIKENEDAHFFCEVYPADAPVKWYISGRQIKHSSKYSLPLKGPQRQLVIKGATKGDEGRVSVVIGDEMQSSADLSVEGTLTAPFGAHLAVTRNKRYFPV